MDKIKSKSRKNSKNKNNRKLNEKNNTPTKKQKFKTNLTKSPKHFDLNDEIDFEKISNLKRKNIDKKNLIIPDNQTLRKIKKTKSDYSNNSFNEKLYDNDEINEDLKLSEKLILQQQLQTAQAKIYLLEQERDKISKTIDNTNNNNILFQQIQNLKNKIDIFENDKMKIKERKNKNENLNIGEKIYLLIKIFRKYAKKFNTIISLFDVNETNEEIFNELKLTIEQYNNVLYNEKLQKIFNFSEKKDNDINQIYLALSEFEPQSFDLFSKYQNQIKNLENENEILKKKISDFENKFNNKEIENLTIQITKIQKEKEKIEENLSLLQKQNKDLNLQITNLKKNEKKFLKETDKINFLNNQITNLNSEINYKDNTIHYLESLLQKFNLQQNLQNNYDNNYNISESINSNKLINSFGNQNKMINQNSINNSNQTFKSISNKENNNFDFENNINSNNFYNNESKFNSDIKQDNIKIRELTQEKEKFNDINEYLGGSNIKINNNTYNYNENQNFNNDNDNENNNENFNNEINEIVVTENKNLNSNNFINESEEIKKPENLQTEIEQLDQEIYNLKNKLKLMISKK